MRPTCRKEIRAGKSTEVPSTAPPASSPQHPSAPARTPPLASIAQPAPSSAVPDLNNLLKPKTTGMDDPLGLFGTNAPTAPLRAVPKPPVPVPPDPPVSSAGSPFVPSPAMHPHPPQSEPDKRQEPSRPLPQTSQVPTVPPRSIARINAAPKPKNFHEKIHSILRPLAVRFKIPAPVFMGLTLLAVLMILAGGWMLVRPSPYHLEDEISPLHIVKVTSAQVGDMDITSYLDLTTKLSALGFSPIIQMTVPQLPQPNFFDVYMKMENSIYAEIVKSPSAFAPQVSFLTVFTNGVWFSTNGREGTDRVEEYLVSQNYPSDTLDQLYVKHVQKLDQLRKEKQWTPQKTGEIRYLTALSDQVRGFLKKSGLPGFKAGFSLWN